MTLKVTTNLKVGNLLKQKVLIEKQYVSTKSLNPFN